ncbi:hypothetical protein ACFIOY_01065 [Bradyrhizobium sp. TZ2]
MSGHVRYAAESGSKFRALPATHRGWQNIRENYESDKVGLRDNRYLVTQLARARWRRHSHEKSTHPLIKRKAGGRYADLVLQLPARGSGSVALHSAYDMYLGNTRCRLTPLHAGMANRTEVGSHYGNGWSDYPLAYSVFERSGYRFA